MPCSIYKIMINEFECCCSRWAVTDTLILSNCFLAGIHIDITRQKDNIQLSIILEQDGVISTFVLLISCNMNWNIAVSIRPSLKKKYKNGNFTFYLQNFYLESMYLLHLIHPQAMWFTSVSEQGGVIAYCNSEVCFLNAIPNILLLRQI